MTEKVEDNLQEMDDGSAVIGAPDEVVENVDESIEDSAAETRQHDEGGVDHTEEIRAQRRTERRLKKEFKHKREASQQHLVRSLQRRNEELEKRLAVVENKSVGFQLAQMDKSLEDQQLRIEWAKRQLQAAIATSDPEKQAQYLDVLTDEKAQLKELQNRREHATTALKAPQANLSEKTQEQKRLAAAWIAKNSWFSQNAKDTDSRIVKVIDQELYDDQWDPADPEYWEELDRRLKERLPHRYGRQRRAVVGGSRDDLVPSEDPDKTISGFHLSRERVEALKQAGVWDDPATRNKFIKRYMDYDKVQRNQR